MRISEIMSKDVVHVSSDRPAAEARAALQRRGIHHVVVVDDGRVIGVVSDRDLHAHPGDAGLAERSVRDVMTPSAVIASPDTTVRKAANLLRGHAIGCLPVLAEGRLVGIVTTTDLLELIGRGVERPVATTRRWGLGRRLGRTMRPSARP